MIQNITQTLQFNAGFTKLWLKFFIFLFFSLLVVSGSVLWQENISAAEQKSAAASANLEEKIRSQGVNYLNLQGADFALRESLRSFANIFTFDSRLKQTRVEERVSNLFEDALYFAFLGDFAQIEPRTKKILEFASEDVFSPDFQKSFMKNLAFLLDYPLDHPAVKVYEALESAAFSFSDSSDIEDDLLALLDKRAEKILEALRGGKTTSSLLLAAWKSNADKLLESVPKSKRQSKYEKYSSDVEALIKSAPLYYTKPLFEIFISLRESAIDSSEDSKQPVLEKEFFTALNRFFMDGKQFVESGQIALADYKPVFTFLLSKIRELTNVIPKDDASVLEFESQMKSLQPFLAFIFSPESENLHGSFDEQFKAFIAQEEEFTEISRLGGQKIEADKKTISPLEDAKRDFDAIGITDAELEPAEESSSFVKIKSAVFAGAGFSGVYDVSRKIFSDLEINQEKYSQGVSLSNFPSFFSAAAKKASAPKVKKQSTGAASEAKSEPSKIEKVLKAKVLEKLTVLGFFAQEEMIAVLDSKDGRVEIKNLNIEEPGEEALNASFEFFNETNEVQSVKFETAIGPIIIPDRFPVFQMKQRVEMLKARSELEKEQEAEPAEPEL